MKRAVYPEDTETKQRSCLKCNKPFAAEPGRFVCDHCHSNCQHYGSPPTFGAGQHRAGGIKDG